MDSITPFDIGKVLILENKDGLLVGDKFSILNHNYAVELALCRVILEHVDLEVEVKETVTDGKNIHFARVEGSPVKQVPKRAKSSTWTFTIMS